MCDVTRDSIIQAAKSAAEQVGADFERATGISQYHVYRLFLEGGWSEVKQLAGLDRHPKDNQPLTGEEILRELP
jgi:hypothetical protein